MSKIRDPKRFSEHFGIAPELLKQRGAFDPILNADTLLFVDPLLLNESAHAEMHQAYTDWAERVGQVLKLLSKATDAEDPAWKAADRLLHFKEFRGTCLGYGSGSIRGTALSSALREQILNTAHRIVELGIEDEEMFALIPLIEEGVGPDSISDMTSHVIAARLAEFTERTLDGVEIEKRPFKIDGREFQLPVNPYGSDRRELLPVILVPLDVLRDLPVASDWDDIDEVTSHNTQLRDRINESIGDIWRQRTVKEKQELREKVLASRDAIELLLEAARGIPREPYDLDEDPEGRAKWLEVGRQLAAQHPTTLALATPNLAGLTVVVEKIIDHYKYLIENQGVWKVLFDAKGKPVHEQVCQKVFFVAADTYCKANDVDVTPEANSGAGPVDFKLSQGYEKRVVVELKLSTNPRLRHGYTKQLEAYKKGERTEVGYFVVLWLGDKKKSRQLDAILDMEAKARAKGEKHSPIIVIDARPRESASKLREPERPPAH